MSLQTYIKDTHSELSHVSWPTRNQAIAFTVITIAISLFVSIYLGFADFLFKTILQKFVI